MAEAGAAGKADPGSEPLSCSANAFSSRSRCRRDWAAKEGAASARNRWRCRRRQRQARELSGHYKEPTMSPRGCRQSTLRIKHCLHVTAVELDQVQRALRREHARHATRAAPGLAGPAANTSTPASIFLKSVELCSKVCGGLGGGSRIEGSAAFVW